MIRRKLSLRSKSKRTVQTEPFYLPVRAVSSRFASQPSPELRDSIAKYGVLLPVIVTKNGSSYTIIDGNQRFQAARELELKRIPAVHVNLSLAQQPVLYKWHKGLCGKNTRGAERVRELLAEARRRKLISEAERLELEDKSEEEVTVFLARKWSRRGKAERDEAEGKQEKAGDERNQAPQFGDTLRESGSTPAPAVSAGKEPGPYESGELEASGEEPGTERKVGTQPPKGSTQPESAAESGRGVQSRLSESTSLSPCVSVSDESKEAEVSALKQLDRFFSSVVLRKRVNGVEAERIVNQILRFRRNFPQAFIDWGVKGGFSPVIKHSFLVSKMCIHMAFKLKWTTLQALHIGVAGLLHDVGLVALRWDPAAAGNAECAEEIEEPEEHLDIGARLVRESRTWGRQIQSVARDHHERWDGSGRPRGKKGEEVDLPGRMVGLFDCFALLIHPWGSDGTTPNEALAKVRELSGRGLFDTEVSGAFLYAFSEWHCGEKSGAGMSRSAVCR